MMDFTIINNQKPFVIMDWDKFERLLNSLSVTKLINNFSPDIVTAREWWKLSKKDIINKIFIEFETQ